ncbi:MAG: hypothetical protein WCT46_05605, partial [Candidatus Gracilibacteria bacterium]|jgi:hypothetical protein
MKKYLTKILATAITLMLTAQAALAAYGMPEDYKPSNIVDTRTGTGTVYNASTVTSIITDLISGLLAIIGIAAVFFLVANGLIYATSLGQQDKIDKAKKGITWSIIGLVAVLFSYILVRFVIKILLGIDEAELTPAAAPASAILKLFV